MYFRSRLRHVVRAGERGQVLPLVAMMLVVLLGAAALGVDVGYWRYQQRLEQSAADSAAIAGAGEMIYSTASPAINAAAQNDATANGFTNGASTTSVVVTPNYNPSQYPNGAVQVVITKTQPAFFGNIFGISGQPVSARAVASVTYSGGGCIYVMKGSISGDLTLNGGGRGGINTSPLCGIVVNGDMSVTGQANVDASSISYAGAGPKGGSYPHGQPVQGVQATDPCLRLAACLYLMNLKTTNPTLFSTAPGSCMDPGGVLPIDPTTNSIPAGHYCNGPYTTSPLTLQAGLYIMDKGMFAGANVQGAGVTIYNNCQLSSPGATNCDTTLNGGNVNNSIVAPTTGPTAGMAYFQPWSLQNSVTVNGAAGAVTYMGGVYAPNADFTFNGQLPTLSLLVAGTITMNGGGINAGSGPGGPLTPANAVLVE